MRVKLSSDDRCAIDLVLESRTAGSGAVDSCFGKSNANLKRHLRAAEKVFNTLAALPAAEPPANLVAKTMKFIRKHEHDVLVTPQPARRPAGVHGTAQRAFQ